HDRGCGRRPTPVPCRMSGLRAALRMDIETGRSIAMSRATPRLLSTIALLASASTALAQRIVYDDALGPGFEDWSYGGGSDLANTAPVHDGVRSIAFSGNAYNAVSFHHA